MRFIIDMQLPPKLASWLRDHGHEAWHLLELGLETAADHAIVAEAQRRGAVIVTKDADFIAIKTLTADAALRVIHVRLGNCTYQELMAAWEPAWDRLLAWLSAGADVVTLDRTRS